MAIGRITGSMLHSNLTRNGVDLAFETNILYLDVTNQRVAIGHTSPETALHINGTTKTTGLIAGGITYPAADGTANQMLVTNGSGQLSFANLSGFTGLTFVGDDSTGSTINTAEILKFAGGNNITTAVVDDVVTITGTTNINVNEISSTDSSAIQINDAINVSGNITLPKETNASVIADTFITRNAHIEAATTAVVNLTVTVGTKPADGKWFGQGSASCYYINGVAAPYIDIQQDKIYRFNQSAASNSGHPINIYYDEYKSRAFPDFSGSSSYVTQVGTAGTSGAYTEVFVDFPSRGRLSYQCVNHGFMGSYLVVKGAADPIQFVSDDSSGFYVGGNEAIRIAGGNSIDTTATQDSTDTITIALSSSINVNEISSTDSSAIHISDAVNMLGNRIQNLGTPVQANDAATKNYVDSGVAGFGPGTVLEITAGTGLTATPTNPITSTGTIALDFTTVVARVVADDSTGTDLRVGETIKIAGTSNITTAVSGDTLTITGSKDIDINSISSTDSTAVQINDGLNVSGTLTANTIQTNELSSAESTAIQVNDSLTASGTITAANFVTHGTSGNITGVNNIEVNQISSNDSSAVQVADSMNVSGTLTATGLVANGITYPTTDGSIGQVLVTDGSGILSFTTLNSFAGITFVGDDSTGSMINTAETLKFTGATGITTAVVDDTVTITGPDLSSYLTNSPITVVGDDSTGTTFNTGETFKVAGSQNITTAVSGDTLTITGPDLSSYLTNSTTTIVGDDSTGTTLNSGETMKFAGATGITTSVTGDTLTITGPDLSAYLTAVPKTIDINQISSGDSSAIQINDAVNISGSLTAADLRVAGAYGNSYITTFASMFIDGTSTNNIVQVSSLDRAKGMGMWSTGGGAGRLYSVDAIEFRTGVTLRDRDTPTGGSTKLTIAADGAATFSNTLTANTFVTNEISSADSSAIQINDAVNILGTLGMNGNAITQLANPTAQQDAATKAYVDSQVSAASTSFLVADDTSTTTTIDSGSTFQIVGAGSVTTSLVGDTITITGAGGATNYTFIGDDSTGTTLAGGSTLQVLGGEGISTAVIGNVLTITNTSTQMEIDGGSAYSIYNSVSEVEIDGGNA